MDRPQFQRARSDEQREVRRQAILAVARDMVAEMPVAEISLNELSRRVGLAKSNVLRYFESREAILLELLNEAGRAGIEELRCALASSGGGPLAERYPRVAATVAATIVANRTLCELMSVSAVVLEHNISPAVARRYKSSAIANSGRLAGLVHAHVPELSTEGACNFARGTVAAITGTWPLAHPSAAMLCVYEDPAFAAHRMDAATALTEILVTLLAGCLSRWPAP
jgi:AcrR family transcriptional regulator